MSLSKQIFLGLAAGLAVGLFFGEKASFLDLPARGFVQLLQVTVLPYVVGSLIAGIARGTPAQARRLASKGGLALLLLWALSLAIVFLSPLALPPDKGGSFYASSELSSEPRIDWLDLYIPSNPFRSLANNVVPAVVVFSVLLGLDSLVPVAIYPFMKRITHWPQAVVGVAFNWGALMGWAALKGELTLAPYLLFCGCVLWTIGYDTIYAHQDKEDDAELGLRSTALKFGDATQGWVGAFYGGAVLLWAAAAVLANAHLVFYVALALVTLHTELVW